MFGQATIKRQADEIAALRIQVHDLECERDDRCRRYVQKLDMLARRLSACKSERRRLRFSVTLLRRSNLRLCRRLAEAQRQHNESALSPESRSLAEAIDGVLSRGGCYNVTIER